jgi:hypothetical protein
MIVRPSPALDVALIVAAIAILVHAVAAFLPALCRFAEGWPAVRQMLARPATSAPKKRLF